MKTLLLWTLLLGAVSSPAWAKRHPAAVTEKKKAVIAEPEMSEPTADLPDLNLDRTDGVKLTLEDSVRLAIQAATNVLKAQNNQELSGQALLQGYGQFLPTVNSSANVTYNKGTTYYSDTTPALVTGTNEQGGYSLTADLNLFNGIADLSNLKSTILQKEAADLSLFRAKQAIALDVTQSFLTMLLDVHLVEIARKNLQESRAHESLLTEQTRVGSKNLADLFRQQAQTSQDESLLLTSENKRRKDQVLLLQKLRLDVSKNYHFVDSPVTNEALDPRFDNENKLLGEGLANRADLKAAGDTAESASWDHKGAWGGGYLPKLDLVGSLAAGGGWVYQQSVNGSSVVPATQNPIFSQLGNQVQKSASLVLTWNLFDRFLTKLDVERAAVKESDAAIDAEDFKNQVLADVRLAYANYKTAAQQLRSSKKGLMAAQKAYEVLEGRYEVGAASFLDLITAQAALLQAESARVFALTNFALQGRTVEFAVGETSVQ